MEDEDEDLIMLNSIFSNEIQSNIEEEEDEDLLMLNNMISGPTGVTGVAGPTSLSESLNDYVKTSKINEANIEKGLTGPTGATGVQGLQGPTGMAAPESPSISDVGGKIKELTGEGIGPTGVYDYGRGGREIMVSGDDVHGSFEERSIDAIERFKDKYDVSASPETMESFIEPENYHGEWYDKVSKYVDELGNKIDTRIDNGLAGVDEEGNKIGEPINLSNTFNHGNIESLYAMGFEKRDQDSNDERIKNLENAPATGSIVDAENRMDLDLYKQYRNKSINNWVQKAILNEDGKTPMAEKIYERYILKQQELNEAKSQQTVINKVKEEGVDETDEDFYKKVNLEINKGLTTRAGESMDDIYGKENVDKVRNAETAEEQRNALRTLRNDSKVDIYYDPQTGEVVNKNLLDEEEIQRQDKKFMETYDEFQFMPINDQVQALKQLENKVAAMANELVGSGQTGTPTLLQALGARWNDAKSTERDVQDMEQMARTGIVPPSVTTLPNGGNILGGDPNSMVKKYNNLVETLNTQRTVVGLNMDPTTSERLGFTGSLIAAIPDAFNLESMNTNEMANRFVYDVMKDELGKNVSEKVKEQVGERGDYYVGALENIGSTITPLAKMSGEILLATALTGGSGGFISAASNIGRITAVNVARLGLNPRTAIKVGEFTSGVLKEAYGLAGSNLIGGALTSSEPMPVWSFATGSQLGHLGLNWMGKTVPKAIYKAAEKNPKLATAVNIMNKHSAGNLQGAVKFGTRPLIGTSAIKAGEFTSGLVDVAEGEMSFDELWAQVTDAESFWDMYGALMFMGIARPDKYSKKVIENFHYDIDNIRGNQPQWNRLARRLNLGTKKEGSWTKEEVEEARLKKINEIDSNEKLSDAEKQAQKEDVEFNANRLNLKRSLDQVNTNMESYDNWNGLSNRLNITMKSLEAGNELTADGITNIAEAGIANGGTSPILELQGLGYSPKQANDLYKGTQMAYGEGQQVFPDVTSSGYKRYVENTLKQGRVKIEKQSLKESLDNNSISEGYYEANNKRLDAEMETLKQESMDLFEEAEGARSGRVAETMKQAEEVLKDPKGQVKELSDKEFKELKKKQGGNASTIGFGLQTTIDGKTVFAINKDMMKEYRKGSTLKHEIYHPVFERKFSNSAIRKRALDIAKKENISEEDALFKANQEVYDYLDSFYGRLKEVGIFEKVEKEMMEVPGYKELKKSGKRNLKIEKEFINEYLELQNEGTLTGLTRDVKIKDIGAEALDLKSGADVVDYFLKGIETTELGKKKLAESQVEYEKLEAEPTTQASEKISDIKSVGKDAETIPSDQVEKIASRVAGAAWNKYGSRIPKNIAEEAGVTRKSYIDAAKNDILTSKWIKKWNGERQPFNQYVANKGMLELKTLATELGVESKDAPVKKRISDKITTEGDREFDVKSEDLTPEEAMVAKESGKSETTKEAKTINPLEAPNVKPKAKEIEDAIDFTEADAVGMRTGGFKGVGETYGGKAASIAFGVPEAKIMDPKKNLTYAKKIKDGIPEPSEAGNIQQAFTNKSKVETFIKNLPETNVSDMQTNIGLEKLDVSRDVYGYGTGISNRVLKTFYNKTGKRSKGLTSQTAIWELKPEFKGKISNETIAKVQKELGITEAGQLNNYDRNIGQLLKGVAKLEGYQIANTVVRKKIEGMDIKSATPTKQLLADLKAGANKMQASEKIIKIGDQYKNRQKKAGAKHIEDLIGTAELVPRIRNVMVDIAPKYFGNILNRSGGLLGTSVWNNSGFNIGKAIRDGMPLVSGIDSAVLKRAKKQAKANFKERGIDSPTEAQLKKEVDKEIKKINQGQDVQLSRDAVAEGLTMEQPQLVKEVLEAVNSTPELANKFSKEQLEKIDLAIAGQEAKKLKKNLENKDDFLEGKSLLLDAYKELLTAHPEAIDIMTQLLYHKNSNTHPLRNLATYLGTELGISNRSQNRNKPYEEHTLPFGEATLLILDAMTSKKTDWAGFKKWLNNNYFQEGISSSPNAKTGDVFGYSQNILDHPKRSKSKGGDILPVWKSKDQMHPELRRQVDEALAGKRKWEDVISADIRKYNEYSSDRGYINPNKMNRFDFNTGKNRTDAERYNVEVPKKLESDPNIIEIQNHLIHQQLIGKMSAKEAREMIDLSIKDAPARLEATKADYKMLSESPVLNLSEKMSTNDLVKKANTIDKALANARKVKKEPKKIRVFDFDDTVGTSKNKVFATKEGETKVLNAEQFAKEGLDLIDKGWDMDFSDFNKVTEGGKGPLFDLMKTMREAKGERDIFILTARAPEAAPAIHEFLKQMGIDIPLENITGLGNSTGKAKADWLVDKAAEGYNDFYFADDAPQNVKAVRDALEVLDIKSQVQQARMNASEKLSEDFNKILEEKTGIGAEKIFSDIKAEIRGNKARKQRFFIPPSAEDFLGLLYATLPKGKKGEAALDFYQKNLFDPYTRATDNLSTDRVNLMADFKALKKQLDVPKDLRKETPSGFTNEQAVRTYLWAKTGKEIPGLSKSDFKELNDIVEGDAKLKAFAEQILSITKGDGYSTPGKNWAVGTITTDLIDVLNTTKRAKYLEPWKENVDIIFSKENMNKLEAAYGRKYREAMENMLTRMKSGSNRVAGGNRLSNQVLDYINNSTGVTMFFNTRSALLQTISSANFVNWSFNNPLMAGKAFANQPQYWKDFVELMNSDYLKDRRNGLKLNINESEIADAAKTSKNKAKAVLNYILEKGYTPTKFADSFAIASGGAMFYRNRINDLVKKGMSESEAKKQAMKEFRQVAEKSQQSSDPSKISQQQSGDLGRIILQYANTPMQYARIQKRAIQDIANGRGDMKHNLSKIIYYGFLQNLMFNALQQGAFALGFGDDFSDEDEEKKTIDTVNGMLDSSLRGLGLGGVTIQVLKNLGLDVYKRSKKKRPEYSDAYYKLLEFSPSIKSKLSRFKSAAYPFDSKKRRQEVFDKGFSLDNPAYESMAKVITAITNVPLDRMYSKINNLKDATADDIETWQAIANVLGWPTWQLEPKKNKGSGSSNSQTVKPKLQWNEEDKSFKDASDSNIFKASDFE